MRGRLYEMFLPVLLVTAVLFLLLTLLTAFPAWIGFGVILLLVVAALLFRRDEGPATPPQAALHTPTAPRLDQFQGTIRQLAQSVESITGSTTRQMDLTSEQHTLIEQTTQHFSTFVDLSESVQGQARSLTSTARQAAESSASGTTAMQEAITSMESIREKVTAIADTIRSLSQLTRRIDVIIGSVSEIATQSNLLALNASIEAARAGIHGRGFAVVAEEVRSLSHQSTQAAHQVRDILEEVQTAMKQAIRVTDEGLQQVDVSMAVAGEADRVMTQLGENVGSAHLAVNKIYEIIREQVEGLDGITISVDRMQRVVHSNQETSRTLEGQTAELTRLLQHLQTGLDTLRDSARVEQDTQQQAEHYA
jgi:methyl-accepting chemotaxis protein